MSGWTIKGRDLPLGQLGKVIEKMVLDDVGKIVKPKLKDIAEQAILAIPTTGSGLTAKKTVITSGKKKATLSRADTNTARIKLGRRRKGNSSGDQQKAIQTAHAKIDRMKNQRIGWLIRNDRSLMTVAFGSYYAGMIVPRDEAPRERLPKVVRRRLESKLKD